MESCIQNAIWDLQTKGDVLQSNELATYVSEVHGSDLCTAEMAIPRDDFCIHG
jgi:hypothetical protein